MLLFNLFRIAALVLIAGITVKHFWPIGIMRFVVAVLLLLVLIACARLALLPNSED